MKTANQEIKSCDKECHKYTKYLDKDIKNIEANIRDLVSSIKDLNINKAEVETIYNLEKAKISHYIKKYNNQIRYNNGKPNYIGNSLQPNKISINYKYHEDFSFDIHADFYFIDDETKDHIYCHTQTIAKVKGRSKYKMTIVNYDYAKYPKLKSKQIKLFEKELKEFILENNVSLNKKSYKLEQFQTLINFK